MKRSGMIEGRLRLVLREVGGAPILERRVSNVILRSGAELLAALATGSATTPINGVAVGVSAIPPSPPYEATALTVAASDGTVLLEQATGTLDPEAINTEVLTQQLKVRVSMRSVLGPGRAVSPDAAVSTVQIAEAALGVLAADGNSLTRIYNRVVFEPVPKGRDQELALYWDIDFSYGV